MIPRVKGCPPRSLRTPAGDERMFQPWVRRLECSSTGDSARITHLDQLLGRGRRDRSSSHRDVQQIRAPTLERKQLHRLHQHARDLRVAELNAVSILRQRLEDRADLRLHDRLLQVGRFRQHGLSNHGPHRCLDGLLVIGGHIDIIDLEIEDVKTSGLQDADGERDDDGTDQRELRAIRCNQRRNSTDGRNVRIDHGSLPSERGGRTRIRSDYETALNTTAGQIRQGVAHEPVDPRTDHLSDLLGRVVDRVGDQRLTALALDHEVEPRRPNAVAYGHGYLEAVFHHDLHRGLLARRVGTQVDVLLPDPVRAVHRLQPIFRVVEGRDEPGEARVRRRRHHHPPRPHEGRDVETFCQRGQTRHAMIVLPVPVCPPLLIPIKGIERRRTMTAPQLRVVDGVEVVRVARLLGQILVGVVVDVQGGGIADEDQLPDLPLQHQHRVRVDLAEEDLGLIHGPEAQQDRDDVNRHHRCHADTTGREDRVLHPRLHLTRVREDQLGVGAAVREQFVPPAHHQPRGPNQGPPGQKRAGRQVIRHEQTEQPHQQEAPQPEDGVARLPELGVEAEGDEGERRHDHREDHRGHVVAGPIVAAGGAAVGVGGEVVGDDSRHDVDGGQGEPLVPQEAEGAEHVQSDETDDHREDGPERATHDELHRSRTLRRAECPMHRPSLETFFCFPFSYPVNCQRA